MLRACDAQPGCLPADRVVPSYKQVLQFCSGKLAMACGMAKNIDSFMPVDKNTIRAHVKTPARAKLAIAE